MLPFCHEGIDEPLLNPIDDLIIRSPLIVNGGNCGEMGARSLHYHDYPNHRIRKAKMAITAIMTIMTVIPYVVRSTCTVDTHM